MQQDQGCVLGVTGFAVKNSMRVDGGSAVMDHGLISLCRFDFHYLTIWRGGEVTNNASIHTRTSLHATRAQSCTSGRAGGLICEPLKAVWPAYAGIVTRRFLVDRASYLLSLVPLCTLESGLHPAPPLTRNSPSPKSSAPQSSSPDP